jgi:hypothetical protein
LLLKNVRLGDYYVFVTVRPHGRDDDAPETGKVPNERRPARFAYRNPLLIALLCRQGQKPTEPPPADEAAQLESYRELLRGAADDLATARGIGTSVSVSITLWAVIISASLSAWSLSFLARG